MILNYIPTVINFFSQSHLFQLVEYLSIKFISMYSCTSWLKFVNVNSSIITNSKTCSL